MKKTESSMTKMINAAFREAAKDVVKRANETGTPIIVWDGKQVKKVSPKKFKNLK